MRPAALGLLKTLVLQPDCAVESGSAGRAAAVPLPHVAALFRHAPVISPERPLGHPYSGSLIPLSGCFAMRLERRIFAFKGALERDSEYRPEQCGQDPVQLEPKKILRARFI